MARHTVPSERSLQLLEDAIDALRTLRESGGMPPGDAYDHKQEQLLVALDDACKPFRSA